MSDSPRVRHAEHLTVPWWLWIPALGVAALLAAEIHLGAPGIRAWLPYALLLPLTLWGLWRLGRLRVAVVGEELQVDDARLPTRHVANAEALTTEEKRVVLGPRSDPLAFVVQRPWVRGTVKVTLEDPDDPTPYWVISSRRPERLVEALAAARRG